MRIESELKLGFKDIMIRPKRSTLKSRSQVSLEREYKFLQSSCTWSGVPIMGANMDTVATFEMALALAKENLFTAIHKHYSLERWNEFMQNAPENISEYFAVSSGIGKNDFKKIGEIFEHHPQLKFICIDVANGYSEHFLSFLKKVPDQYPDKVIIAGNVVTGEIVEELLLTVPIL
jgi:GMP reductase